MHIKIIIGIATSSHFPSSLPVRWNSSDHNSIKLKTNIALRLSAHHQLMETSCFAAIDRLLVSFIKWQNWFFPVSAQIDFEAFFQVEKTEWRERESVRPIIACPKSLVIKILERLLGHVPSRPDRVSARSIIK
jgi:hypothetical protein